MWQEPDYPQLPPLLRSIESPLMSALPRCAQEFIVSHAGLHLRLNFRSNLLYPGRCVVHRVLHRAASV